jgi:hypothetical protein
MKAGLGGLAMNELEINQQVAEQICNAGRLNGKLFRVGECVALLDGKVVAVAKDLNTALQALRAFDPNPHRGMIFEVGPPVTDVIRREQNDLGPSGSLFADCFRVRPFNRGLTSRSRTHES